MTTDIIERLFAEVDAEWPGEIPPMDHLQIAYATSIAQKALAITQLARLARQSTVDYSLPEMIADLRGPWLEIPYHDRERISEILIELNNRACTALTAKPSTEGDDEYAEWLRNVADNKNALVRVHAAAAVEKFHRIADRLTAKLNSEALVEALAALEKAEATYRYAHDILGTGDPKTGRASRSPSRAG